MRDWRVIQADFERLIDESLTSDRPWMNDIPNLVREFTGQTKGYQGNLERVQRIREGLRDARDSARLNLDAKRLEFEEKRLAYDEAQDKRERRRDIKWWLPALTTLAAFIVGAATSFFRPAPIVIVQPPAVVSSPTSTPVSTP